ncbi:hypothetical protein [Burkholderia alba]|uniref:hypothetical protein n=1 Tax=Burkholderia alba TaxID=2683677 RepID=UPI002B0533D9|nr:hypothetical protein [Burkholderia alba]
MATPIVARHSHRVRAFRIQILRLASVAGALLASSLPAHADDWGCQVTLCLSDPRGAETENACVPPIEKLWDALSHGDPFPKCDMMASFAALAPEIRAAIPQDVIDQVQASNMQANNRGASGSYCAYSLMYYNNNYGPACRASNVIEVVVNGKVLTRVWWGIGGFKGQSSSITEYYAPDSATQPYNPAQSAAQWWQDYQDPQHNPNGGNRGPGGLPWLFTPRNR